MHSPSDDSDNQDNDALISSPNNSSTQEISQPDDLLQANQDPNKVSLRDFPVSVRYILGTEAAERFCYYGTRIILPLFLTQVLKYSENNAVATIHAFIAFTYFTPLIGAYLADAKYGRYSVILYLGFFYAFGCMILSLSAFPALIQIPSISEVFCWIALFIIALGAGGIKPNVSSMIADQLSESQLFLIPKIFSVFYFAINFGSFFSQITTPLLRAYVSFWAAFGLPAILMMMAVFVFWGGRHKYVKSVPTTNVMAEFYTLVRYAWANRKTPDSNFVPSFDRVTRFKFLDAAREKFGEKQVKETRLVFNVSRSLVPLIGFWMCYDQTSSRFVFQAQLMDRRIGSIVLEPDQIPAVNAIFIMILVPFYEAYVYPFMKKHNIPHKPLYLMSYGMILCALTFFYTGFLSLLLENGLKVHIIYQVFAHFLVTNGEILTSITMLSFSYSQTSPRLKSVILAVAQMTITLGNLITLSVVEASFFKEQSSEFFLFAILMGLFVVLFAWLNKDFHYVDPVYGDGSILELTESKVDENKNNLDESFQQ